MAYIGRGLDKISNIEHLDTITFDGSSSYSLTKSSVAYTPNSAQSLLVSIDGVVQSNNFTVSGSTIDFGVAVPSTSTCDFIKHFGTGVAFTPADGTVTNAKIASSIITGQTEDTTPADDDLILVYDTSASGLKKVQKSNFAGGGGNYSVYAFDTYNYTTNVGGTTSNDYVDIAGGNYVSFTPTSTDDIIFFSHGTTVYSGYTTAADPYLMMSTSSSIGSGDTKLNFSGRYANGSDVAASVWDYVSKSFYLPCTSLSVGTTYYVEQAAGTYSTGNWWYINYGFTNHSGNHKLHNVAMIHYKKES